MHPSLGAEVTGVDLSAPIDEPTRHALSRALADHLALVFHDQSLTPAQYLAAASVFGPPMEQHYSQHNMTDFPLIGLIWHRNGQQPAEQWHTDHTNRERPPAATVLYGQEIPSAGGGTSVANMRAAYLALHDDERRRLEALTTFNGLDGHADTRPEDQDRYGKPVEHPMVRTHPVHGSRGVLPHLQGHPHRRDDPRGEPGLHARSARPDDPARDRLSSRLAQGRRPGHRRPGDDAPRPRRL
jgi:taurine dioxygenase